MSTFQTSDGLTLYYEDDGAGLPLLCLAGLTRTARDFDYVAPHLPGCRLIKMDYRGRGKSDWDDNWENYTLPIECRDVMELLQHLSLQQVAILGTSRGGINAMGLAKTTPDTVLGVALNDIGPEIDTEGMSFIMGYLGRKPTARSHASAAAAMSKLFTGFHDVPRERWLREAETHYIQGDKGLEITYDPKLREATEAQGAQTTPDLWPYFDAVAGKPLALIWGENSDLLKAPTVQEMQRRRPDMVLGQVPGRGHIPFLDEPESLAALHKWLELLK